MNIIQLQDRLKGLPEQTLRKYVEQPMGEVPIYLALGELQRRNEMKERFQATKAEELSISEQIVAESKPQQMGLGAMAPQRMMPLIEGIGTPGESPAMDPRQLAASGIAANPQSAVGGTAMMAGGGIVGYGKGDYVKKGIGGLKWLKEFILGRKGKDAVKAVKNVKGREPIVSPGGVTWLPGIKGVKGVKGVDAVPELKNFALRNKLTTIGLGGYAGLEGYDALFGEDGNLNLPEKGTSKEELQKAIDALNKPKKGAGDKPKLTEKQTLEKRAKEIENIIGPDEGRKKIDERLAEKEKSSLNMAAIMAGLTMAGGKSPNFLENLTAGATAGLGSYTDTQADIFELEAELAKADRSERIAIIGEALADGRIDRELAVKLRAAVIAGPQVAPMAAPAAKEVADINQEIRRLQVAEQEEISKGNTEKAAKIRTMILNRIKVKNEAIKDSVSLSTDPSTYSAGTGQTTNDPVGIR